MITIAPCEIKAKDLGVTSSREHISIDMRYCVEDYSSNKKRGCNATPFLNFPSACQGTFPRFG